MSKRKYEDDDDSDIEEVYSTVPPVRKPDPMDDLLREVFDSGKISSDEDQEDVEVIEVRKKNGEVSNEEDEVEEEDDDPEEEEEEDDDDPEEEDDDPDDPEPVEEKNDEKVKPSEHDGEDKVDDDDDEDDDDEEEEEAEDLARIRKAQGDCLITPFNMKEEMEEGHFDEEGTYHWKKDKVVQDNWLENIDWVKVKNGEEGTEGKLVSDDTVDSTEAFDCIAVYKKILHYMKPKDTIGSAIRRLGGNKTVSSAEKWKRKKAGESTDEDAAGLQKVTDLTELANLILNKTGNMDIYEETYEKIVEKINKPIEKPKNVAETSKAPELDMYADDFADKEKAKLEGESAAKKPKLSDETSSDNEPTSSSDISSSTSACQKNIPVGEASEGCDSAEVDAVENPSSSP